MKELSLFTGCLIPNRYPGIEKATGLVLDRLGSNGVSLQRLHAVLLRGSTARSIR